MKVNINDMTARERVVLTKAQLFDVIRACTLNITCDLPQALIADVDMPDIIEVEEVLGE